MLITSFDRIADNIDDKESRYAQSLTESVLAYREENGRTYHAYREGAYWFPNDAKEIDRLGLLHEIIRRAMGNVNAFAPWTQSHYPHRVLDVATGTGDWCFDFANEFPQTELIIGTDLSHIQPAEMPPNVVFCIDDSTQEWLDTDLDYVHLRCTNGCWDDAYTQIVQQAFDKLNPGGWFECQETATQTLCCEEGNDDDDEDGSGTIPVNNPFERWLTDLARLSHIVGKPIDDAPRYKAWLEQAGFVDIQERIIKIPLSSWSTDRNQRDVGLLMEEMLPSHLSGLSNAYHSRVNGTSSAELELSLIPVRAALRDRSARLYINLHVVIGRKPENTTL
ncbi:tam domain protein [Coniella lustricola]|uniref:Tam domain protein n=1 Tax=Coniella lustricola TaxID=2025994 RepID=A0A2T3AFW4_9PEZI|nr:tam domain protein [Coniella lustricola]